MIISYFLIAGLYTLAAALIWGVNTLFLLDAGLNIREVFLANAAFAVGSVVFEIPTGVLADTRGRRASFLLSVAILFVTTLGYVLVAARGGGLVAFCAVSVLMGLGFTFYSGAVEAWLVDALQATGHEGPLDPVFARGAMVTGGAMLVGTMGGGWLGTVDLALPYIIRAAMLAVVFAAGFYAMREWGFRPQALSIRGASTQMQRVANQSLQYGWRLRSIRLLMISSFVQTGFLMWGFYAWQPYFLELFGRDAVWVAGVVSAMIAVSTIFGNGLADWFSRFCGRRTTLLLWAAGIQAIAVVGVGLADSFWVALAMLLFVAAAMGITRPAKQAYLHSVVPSEQRASMISFDSMVGNMGGALGQAGLGHVSQVGSIAEGYVIGGLMTLLVLPVFATLRRLGERSDTIEGRGCGCPTPPCAGQGLPDLSLIDATPRRGTSAHA